MNPSTRPSQEPRRPHRHLGALVVTFALLAGGAPAAAEVMVIDPSSPPAVTLPPAEAARLATLQSAAPMFIGTDVSPDDAVIVVELPRRGPGFLDLRTRAFTPVALDNGFSRSSNATWRDAQTLVYIGRDQAGSALVGIDRSTGKVSSVTRLSLPGAFPVSLAPGGKKLLLAVLPVPPAVPAPPGPPAPDRRPATPVPPGVPPELAESPFDLQLPRAAYRKTGPIAFDADQIRSTAVASNQLRLAVLDLATGVQKVLLELPAGSNLANLAWSPDASRLAIVRAVFPDFSRGGEVSLEDLSTQDGLGKLPPEKNPFYVNNVLDIFTLAPDGEMQRKTMPRPARRDRPVFASTLFSPDGRTLMAQLWSPGTPHGRRYPSYAHPNRSSYVFYDVQGRGGGSLGTLDRLEVSAPNSVVPMFVGPDELVFDAVHGPTWGLFHYNRRTGSMRQLATGDGAIYQVRPTNFSKEIVYNHGSFTSPYELYKIGLHDRAPTPLSDVNAAVAAANQVRVDKVSFDLKCGERRRGYLVQPAGASFPPRDVPIVVWQLGGPAAPMTSDWGGHVEQPFNLLPNFGFAILMVPLPGREGFGPDFLDGLADSRNFGQVDIAEQAEIAEQLIRRGYTSRAKLGITGCSYGGYFTSQSITRYPDLYAAANMQCSLLDLVHEWHEGYKPYVSFLEGRTPLDELEEYQRDSPLHNAGRVKTPVLVFSGNYDFLPYTISQAFHDAVNAAGTPSDFLLFNGEGHGLENPNSQRIAAEAQLTWFRRYLTPQPPVASQARSMID